MPAVKLANVTWLIASVAFLSSEESGTTAEVVLMPASAFVPEPENLLPFDATLGKELPGGGANNYQPAPR